MPRKTPVADDGDHDSDGCLCSIHFPAEQALADDLLPPARGGIAAASEDDVDGCGIAPGRRVMRDADLPTARGGVV